jgi:hypothetical protein
MRWTALLICVLALAACGEDTANDNRGRIVTQDRLDNPLVPVEHVDSAVQTEAQQVMSMIAGQVKLKASLVQGAERTAFYRAISGRLNASSLAKLGLTEAELKTSFYQASDYSLVIVGKQLTISAGEPGTRGRVEPMNFPVP